MSKRRSKRYGGRRVNFWLTVREESQKSRSETAARLQKLADHAG